jgi:hypothetical protein
MKGIRKVMIGRDRYRSKRIAMKCYDKDKNTTVRDGEG